MVDFIVLSKVLIHLEKSMEVQTPQDEESWICWIYWSLSENWKILIFGPLLAGIAAWNRSGDPQDLREQRIGSGGASRFQLYRPMAASLAMSADVLHQIALLRAWTMA